MNGYMTDEELMAAYLDGDPAAFRTLFDRLAPWLLRILRVQLAEADARDVLQQTFLQVHRARADFRRGERLKPWLVTISLNLKRAHFRRHGRRPEGALDGAPEPAVEAGGEDAVLRRQVAAALARLPEGQAEVIALHYYEGLSFPEVAAMLGLSLSAVKVRAHRGYGALRGILEPPE